MKMKKWASSLLALSLVTSLSAGSVFADSKHGKGHDNGLHLGWYKQTKIQFQDIDGYSWAKEAIESLASEGILRGVSQNQFNPGGQLNRAQFAALVTRYFGLQPADASHEDFTDVHTGDMFFRDIESAKDYMTMFVNGTGGYSFNPNQPINRAEAAVTLVQLLLKHNNIQLVTQDQANQILSVYADAYLIPQNLRIHVATAVQAGVIKGVATNRFDPLTTLNRAQAATLLYRLQSQLQFLPIDPTTGAPIEVVPGTPGTDYSGGTTDTTTPTVSYQSSSYNLTVGSQVVVSSNELGAVYLVPTGYSPSNVSSLDSLVNSNVASKATVGQINSNVSLNTSNLAAGNYVIYVADLAGNIGKYSYTVNLSGSSVDTNSPTISYQSSSYNLNAGDQVVVSSNELGSVYLISNAYTPNSVSALDSLVNNSSIGTKTTVGQINSSVALNTSNLTAGNYTIYVTDLSGNIGRYSYTIHLNTAAPSISSVQTYSRSVDTNGVTHLTVTVQTTNAANNNTTNVELINTNGTSLNPVISTQTTIYNNTATATLDIPSYLASGDYRVKVTVGNSTNQSLTFTK
jgi:hypothetical protein